MPAARQAERLAEPQQTHLVLHRVQHALRSRLDAVGDLPAAGALQELHGREIGELGWLLQLQVNARRARSIGSQGSITRFPSVR